MQAPLVNELVARIEELAPRGPDDAPLWVLVPSAGLARELQHTLVERDLACAGVFAHTPAQATHRILANRGETPRPRIATATLLAWLRNEIQDARTKHPLFFADDLRYLARFPSARRYLLRTLLDVRLWEVGYGTPVRPASQRGKAFLSFLPELGNLIERSALADPASRLARALDAFSKPHATDPGHILVLATGPEETADLVGILRTAGERIPVHCIAADPDDDTHLFSRTLAFDPSKRSTELPELRVFSAQGEESELSEAVRRARELVAGGVRPEKVAIVAPNLDPYEPLLESVFRQEGLPLVTPVRRPLAATPTAVLAMRVLRLCTQDVPRALLCGVLADGALATSAFRRARDEWTNEGIGALDEATREAGCLGGSREIRTILDDATRDDAPVERWKRALQPMRAALLRFLDILDRARQHIGAARSARRQADLTVALLDRLLVDDENGTKNELLVRTGLLAQRSLIGLRNVAMETLPEAVFELIADSALPISEEREGIRAQTLESARGYEYEHVFLLGLNRDQLPRSHAPHPHLTEADTTSIRDDLSAARGCLPTALQEGLSTVLPSAEERDASSRADLESLIRSTRGRLTVSFLRANAHGQPKSPSPWLRHVSRMLAHVESMEQLFERGTHFETVAWAPAERIASMVARERSLSEREAALHAAFSGGTQALRSVTDRLSPEVMPACSAACDWIETRDSFLERGGVALAFDAIGLGGEPGLRDGLSVSAFASLGECALRFFFERVLRLQPLPEEPRPEDISRKHVGIAIHGTLHRIYSTLAADGYFAADAAPLDALEVAKKAVVREVEALRSTLLSSQAQRLPLLRDRTLQAWKESLDRVIELDLAELQESGFRPLALEKSIAETLELGDQGEIALHLFGRLDRIDGLPAQTGSGTFRKRIVDYKTGGAFDPESKEIRAEPFKGKRLQLPVYSMLAREREDEPYPFAELRGVAPEQLAACDGALPRKPIAHSIWKHYDGLEETLVVLAALLAFGDYPFRKGPLCRWCAFRAACPRNHAPSIARLGRVDRLRAFHRLGDKNLRNPTLASLERDTNGGGA